MHCAYCGSWVEQVSYIPCSSCGRPTNGAPVRVTSAVTAPVLIVIFVVIGGLAVVAVVGILAAIAIPNFLTAKRRAAQKRTMADIRTMGVAVESYAVDNNVYPRAASVEELTPLLVPKYAASIAHEDGWKKALRYRCADETCSGYAIMSSGADGVFEHEQGSEYEKITTMNFDCDIVFRNGAFVQYPQGVQH
jgi:type II secretory pathway pseudopilin PulG